MHKYNRFRTWFLLFSSVILSLSASGCKKTIQVEVTATPQAGSLIEPSETPEEIVELNVPLTATPEMAPSSTPTDEVEGWAVLVEKDNYDDVGMTNLETNFVSLRSMSAALIRSGWNPAHIHRQKEFDQSDLKEELDWLEENADENDVVFVYIAGHGRYIGNIIDWNNFFPKEWAEVQNPNRILVLDSCEAGKYINALRDDPTPQIAIGAVDDHEYGWCGLEEEGLPIIGNVFTHFLTESIFDSASDTDQDGRISIQEAALFAETKQREYMQEVVFAIPEFAQTYRNLGINPDTDKDFPHVVILDTIEQPAFLTLASEAE